MKLPHFSKDISIRPSARSLYLKGDSRGVLLFHGWTGYPGEMEFLGRELNNAGFTVYIPRLPGHGTGGEDFILTNARDWLRRSMDAYLELTAETEEICVAGLSMGGLLTLCMAALFSPRRIALAAPAVAASNRWLLFSPLARHFVKRIKKRPYRENTNDEDRTYFAREYWSWNWIAQASALRSLQRMTKRALPRVTVPTLTIVSSKDPTVPLRAADIVEKGISSKEKKRIVLNESPHVLVNGPEREHAAKEIIRWFSQPL